MGSLSAPHDGQGSGPTRLLPIECFNASQPEEYLTRFTTRHPRDTSLRPIPPWTWARDLPPARAALHETCGRAATPGCNPHTICIGWADLYYVPSKLHLSFRRLAHGLAQAAPTRSRRARRCILAQESRRPLHRLPCWGFCSATPCPDLLLRHACGPSYASRNACDEACAPEPLTRLSLRSATSHRNYTACMGI